MTALASPIERGKPELEIIGTAKRTDRQDRGEGEGRGYLSPVGSVVTFHFLNAELISQSWMSIQYE